LSFFCEIIIISVTFINCMSRDIYDKLMYYIQIETGLGTVQNG